MYVVVVVATHKMKLNETDFFNSRPFDNTSNLLVYSTQKHASILIYECTWHMAYTIHIYIYDVVALVALWLGAPCMGNTAPQHHTSHTWCTKNPGRERERKKNRTGGSYIFEGTVNLNGWVIHFAPHPSAWAPAPSLPRLLWLDKRTSHNYSLFSFRFRNKTKNTVRLQNSIVSPDDVWLVWWWRWWWDFWEKRQKHGVARGEHLFLLRIAADWWHSWPRKNSLCPCNAEIPNHHRRILSFFLLPCCCRFISNNKMGSGMKWRKEKNKKNKNMVYLCSFVFGPSESATQNKGMAVLFGWLWWMKWLVVDPRGMLPFGSYMLYANDCVHNPWIIIIHHICWAGVNGILLDNMHKLASARTTDSGWFLFRRPNDG